MRRHSASQCLRGCRSPDLGLANASRAEAVRAQADQRSSYPGPEFAEAPRGAHRTGGIFRGSLTRFGLFSKPVQERPASERDEFAAWRPHEVHSGS